MNIKQGFHFLTLAIAFGSATVHADADVADAASGRKGGAVSEAAIAKAQEKFAQAMRIVDQFKDQAQAQGINGANWRFEMLANLMRGPEANFAAVGLARTFGDAMSASSRIAPGSSAPPAATPMSLGTTTSDLVYVPITPCRILDTRGNGGPLAAGSSHDYYFSASNPGFGACSVVLQIPGSSAAAAFAVNVTVDETGLSGFGIGSYLQLFPQGSSTTTSFINFGPGQVIANSGVLTVNQATGLFTLYTSAPAQVIMDTYGVFVAPEATALDCVDTTKVTGNILGNHSLSITANACPATHTAVSGSCFGGGTASRSVEEAVMSATSRWVCRFQDYSNTSYEVAASTRCCRVPGR